mmetsp:Transcript_21679/g.20792  ORF Transcript_21679/g.20792 Transcript_21679/m.20792 type:complete len:166 (+) Transcript_21679:431-928(+)
MEQSLKASMELKQRAHAEKKQNSSLLEKLNEAPTTERNKQRASNNYKSFLGQKDSKNSLDFGLPPQYQVTGRHKVMSVHSTENRHFQKRGFGSMKPESSAGKTLKKEPSKKSGFSNYKTHGQASANTHKETSLRGEIDVSEDMALNTSNNIYDGHELECLQNFNN